MPRQRIYPAGIPFHLVHRGVDRREVFFVDDDRARYLAELCLCARRHDVDVHCYVLMGNHVHLLVTGHTDGAISRLMRDLGRRYVPVLNGRRGRTGPLWSGRHYSAAVETDRYLLACYRYIELYPVRAGLVKHPAAFRWSSHRANGFGIADDLVTPHPTYLALGTDSEARRESYARLFRAEALTDGQVEREGAEFRAALSTHHTSTART